MFYENTKETKKILNQVLADCSVLYLKIHQSHWYMRGHHFFHMHQELDNFMSVLEGYIDDVAERLITIGGSPLSTFQEYLDVTSFEDANVKGNWEKSLNELMLQLIRDYVILDTVLHQAFDITNEEGDAVSNDTILQMIKDVEKTIWMLKAAEGKAPWELDGNTI